MKNSCKPRAPHVSGDTQTATRAASAMHPTKQPPPARLAYKRRPRRCACIKILSVQAIPLQYLGCPLVILGGHLKKGVRGPKET